MKSFRIFAFFVALGVLASCEKSSRVISMSKSDSASDKKLEGTGSDGSTLTTPVNSKYRGNQYMDGKSGTATEGSSMTFPFGSLSINANVSMGAGDTLASSAVASGLGINTTFNGAGSSVKVGSDPAQNTANPFILSIPVPQATSLTSDLEKLVVIFEQYNAVTKSYVVGLMTPDSFTVEGSKIKLKITKFGTYQAAFTATKITAPVKKDGAMKDITPSDKTAPKVGVFLASTSVVSTGFTLNWTGALDDVSASSSLKYLVCSGVSLASIDTVAKCEAATIEMQYTANLTQWAVSGKSASTTYYLNVVVKDSADNKAIYPGISQATQAPDVTAPTPGGLLAISAPTATGMTITWPQASDDMTAAGDLQYFLCSSSGAILTVAACEGATLEMAYITNMLTKTVNGKTPSTTYHFAVIVKDQAGNKALYTETFSATSADTTAPTAPGFLTTTSVTSTSFTLNWNAGTDDVTPTANLYYFVCSGANAAAIDTAAECVTATQEAPYTANLTSLNITSKSPSTTYYYNVVIKDAAGNTAIYDGATVTTSADSTPPTPGSFQTSASVTGTGFALIWSVASDNLTSSSALEYFVCSGASPTAIDTVAKCEGATAEMSYTPNVMTYFVTGKSPSTTYYYNVVVKDSDNNKSIYPGKTQATTVDTTAPTIGTFSASTSVTMTGFTLNWTAASDDVTAASGLSYLVCSGASILAIDTVAECEGATAEMGYTANTISHVISGKSAGTTYFYNVVVKDVAGNKSIYAGKSQATAADTTPPTVTITRQSAAVTGSTSMSWTATFSETVTGFSAASLSFSGSISSSGVSGSGSSYTITANVPAGSDANSVFPNVLVNGAYDTATTPNPVAATSGSSQVITYYIPITITPSGTPIVPASPGLTRIPTLQFSIDRPTDKFDVFTDGSCSALNTGSKVFSSGANTLILDTNLPTTGTHQLYAIAKRSGVAVDSACTYIGSYTTGINKIAVVTASGTADWACAIANGGLKCWGQNSYGQLGTGNLTNLSAPGIVFAENSNVTDLAMSVDWQTTNTDEASTCALVNGGVKCWGSNTYGQLGNNTAVDSSSPVDVIDFTTSVPITGVSSIYGSTGRFCALKSSGSLFCWGRNTYGAVGANVSASTTSIVVAKPVESGTSFSQVSMGNYYSCAVTSGGGAKCWGFNNYGKLGDATTTNRILPTSVTGLVSGVLKVSTDDSSTCALVSSGGVQCWGVGTNGRLGRNSVTNSSSPVAVSSLSTVTDIINGAFSFAVTGSGIKGWGVGLNGQQFSGGASDNWVPITSSNLTGATTGFGWSMAGGSKEVICAIDNGGVRCIGNGDNTTLLGLGVASGGYTIAASSGVTQVSASSNFSCALIGNSSAKCWGLGTGGQLGDGANATSVTTPVTVSSLP